MTTVAVLVEARGGEATQPTHEAITLARTLGTPVAVWLGGAPDPAQNARLGIHGAAEVRVVPAADEARQPARAAAALAVATQDADIVLMISTFVNKEIATRLALLTGAGVVVDAAGVELVDGHVETLQTVFAATWDVRTRIAADKAIVAVRPNTTLASPAEETGAATTVVVDVELPEVAETIVSVEPVPVSEGMPLAEAPVVVSGGRGTNGDYALVSELAELLGGAVGASRDATDEGWISHEHMVGQTGTTVTPALYVACGISGAVHHRGGMQASGTIVAVNIDPDAPIFEIADFGVVGDLNDVLPQAIARIEEHRRG
ncbi:electron transfer flavoprotein subunit alpha/FixB family protein [Demequina lignilytica]|uniref:Electron transfer flavoprotein subunit alpha/FixB family protein n=1 Tax=Demequina lignilytica TaxID=3051663 RepID=A0AB35MJW9_9MICO|nr:electron transfer flavoprotein subunit alpha/FixB family protein [Demequina sp. SYSU T0a273]MDN4484121.1 electron transfer flavoprotein subunit alpha/FixB family protein [Demequina sp. SYSU T0a273]